MEDSHDVAGHSEPKNRKIQKAIKTKPLTEAELLQLLEESDSDTEILREELRWESSDESDGERILLNLGIKPEQTSDILEKDELSVRQSRRIAQIKIREDAEHRKAEEIVQSHQEAKAIKKYKKSQNSPEKAEKRKTQKIESDSDDVIEVPVTDTIERKKKKRKKTKDPRKLFDESHPWRSSSDESSDINEAEEEDYVVDYSEPEEEPLQFKSDHEFSPESDVEDPEYEPTKRARTARKESDEEINDDFSCEKCGKSDHPEWVLLCDKCDSGWHCSCLRPPIFVIPEGDWFCPQCQHNNLILQLQEKLQDYEKKLAKKELEDRRKERLAYVGISLNNVLKNESKKKYSEHDGEPSSSGSDSDSNSSSASSDSDEPIYQLRQRRQARSYRFNEYDDLINSAIQDEMEAVKGAGNQGRGKDIANIVNANEKKEEEKKPLNENFPEPLPPVVPRNSDENKPSKPTGTIHFGRKKGRKLNCLDIESEDDAFSDEDFKGSSSQQEEEDEITDSEGSQYESSGPVRRSARIKSAKYDKDFNNDSSSDDGAFRRRKKREKWVESDSEESDGNWAKGKRKIRHSYQSPKKRKLKKKKKKNLNDSDLESYQRKKKPRIAYGGLTSDDEDLGRRTRGKKMNYLESFDSDSDVGKAKKATKKSDTDEDYVGNEEDVEEDDKISADIEAEADEEHGNSSDSMPVRKVPKLKVRVRRIIESDDEDETNHSNKGADNTEKPCVPITEQQKETTKEDSENELNTSDETHKHLDEMDEAEIEKMMEDEEYANKQLQLVAIQIEKKRRKEEKAKKRLQKDIEISQNLKDTAILQDKKIVPSQHVANISEQSPQTLKIPKYDTSSEHKVTEPQSTAIDMSSSRENTVTLLHTEERIATSQTLKITDKPQLQQERTAPIPSHPSQSAERSFPSKPSESAKLLDLQKNQLKIKFQPTQITNKLQQSLKTQFAKANLPKTDLNINKGESIVGNVESLLVNSVDNEDLSEPPSASLPLFSQLAQTSVPREQTPKKQSRAKKSIRDALANMEMVRNQNRKQAGIVNVDSTQTSVGSSESKIEIAAPPQPFSQSHPTPSIITRMLQSAPLSSKTNTYPVGSIRPKQFAMLTERDRDESPPLEKQSTVLANSSSHMTSHYATSGAGTSYPQLPPTRTNYASGPPHIPRNSSPHGLQSHLYHSHRSMEPGPVPSPINMSRSGTANISGTSPLNMTTGAGKLPDRSSPALSSSSSASPVSKQNDGPSHSAPLQYSSHPSPRVPPPPTIPPRHLQAVQPHLLHPRNMQSMQANYHYGNYPPPPPISNEDAMPPSAYQNSPYSEQFVVDGNASNNQSDNSSSKGYDEEVGGEFGGLVSYFSSQREDDLDS